MNEPNTKTYYTDQIITYMGNKRKFLTKINDIISHLEEKEGRKLSFGDGFAGSGIVSRLFKNRASQLYTNDISGYSRTLNECYLSNFSPDELKTIEKYIVTANRHADRKTKKYAAPFIHGRWSPLNDSIKENERVYFTAENGERIDILRNYIETIPLQYRPYLLASLLVECSIHNNTNGQFSAFYKNGSVGQYGGKNNIDLHRITKPIRLQVPVYSNSPCEVHIDQKDTNEWIKEIPEVDVMYYDPPYNKHPYNIFYFLLDIVNTWDKSIVIPDTYRGQPMHWEKSKYNSSVHAKRALENLIENTRAKYVLLSYNNGGIIPVAELDRILKKHGKLEKIPVEHKTYNRLKGISEYKRQHKKNPIQEYFWLLTKE